MKVLLNGLFVGIKLTSLFLKMPLLQKLYSLIHSIIM